MDSASVFLPERPAQYENYAVPGPVRSGGKRGGAFFSQPDKEKMRIDASGAAFSCF